MWSLPAREEIGRWVGDVQLVPGESRDTRVRSTRGICAVRYAQEASRMLQIGLVSDLVQAVKELHPRSDTWLSVPRCPSSIKCIRGYKSPLC